MARSTIPTFPLIIFGVVEPALLIWAYIVGTADPFAYFADQAPNHAITASNSFPPQALGLTLQMLNVLLLLAPIAVLCSFSRDATTARAYLLAVALADYGHIYGTYRAVGADYFWNPAGWNGMVAGSVGVSAALNVLRLLTLAGGFGPIRETLSGVTKNGKKRI
ncbi:hypothetical protein B0H66DRAFT_554912 [Apodospora peruviana]|uniref:DUF7704 domain-containing protein n=1 Tax=Apodospora peruviana TaxID=516989 RepID=A0AAE0ICY6_9PEZI|nr:hypothetical protein B0H66DRAFT_554912 [Apodospora peruviana]